MESWSKTLGFAVLLSSLSSRTSRTTCIFVSAISFPMRRSYSASIKLFPGSPLV